MNLWGSFSTRKGLARVWEVISVYMDMTFMRFVIITRMKIKINGSSEFITFYNIRNPFNPHLYYTIIPCFSICSKPHRTRMCSILLFLHNLPPQDHHQNILSSFQTSASFTMSFCILLNTFVKVTQKFMSVQERRPFIKHWD